MTDQNAREMNDRVRNLDEIIRQIQQRSVLPVSSIDIRHWDRGGDPYRDHWV